MWLLFWLLCAVCMQLTWHHLASVVAMYCRVSEEVILFAPFLATIPILLWLSGVGTGFAWAWTSVAALDLFIGFSARVWGTPSASINRVCLSTTSCMLAAVAVLMLWCASTALMFVKELPNGF